MERNTLSFVAGRTSWSFNPQDGSDGVTPVEVRHEGFDEFFKPGKLVKFDVAAPGTGYLLYRIKKVDRNGAWGALIVNTVRELTPEEVV